MADHVMDRLADVIDLIREHPLSGSKVGKLEIPRMGRKPYPYVIF